MMGTTDERMVSRDRDMTLELVEGAVIGKYWIGRVKIYQKLWRLRVQLLFLLAEERSANR